MPLRPCLGSTHHPPGHTLVRDSNRCPDCNTDKHRQRDARRGGTTTRSYGTTHQRTRARLLPAAYYTDCPRCSQQMLPSQQLDLGHSDPAHKRLGLPGDRIEHADCNRSNNPMGSRARGRGAGSTRNHDPSP